MFEGLLVLGAAALGIGALLSEPASEVRNAYRKDQKDLDDLRQGEVRAMVYQQIEVLVLERDRPGLTNDQRLDLEMEIDRLEIQAQQLANEELQARTWR